MGGVSFSSQTSRSTARDAKKETDFPTGNSRLALAAALVLDLVLAAAAAAAAAASPHSPAPTRSAALALQPVVVPEEDTPRPIVHSAPVERGVRRYGSQVVLEMFVPAFAYCWRNHQLTSFAGTMRTYVW